MGYSSFISINGVSYKLDGHLKRKKKKLIYLNMINLIISYIGSSYLRSVYRFAEIEFALLFFASVIVGTIILITLSRRFISIDEVIQHLVKN